jgi:hypothetical protein
MRPLCVIHVRRRFLNNHLRHFHHVPHALFIPVLVSKSYVSRICHVWTSPTGLESWTRNACLSIQLTHGANTCMNAEMHSRSVFICPVKTRRYSFAHISSTTRRRWGSVDTKLIVVVWMELNSRESILDPPDLHLSCRGLTSVVRWGGADVWQLTSGWRQGWRELFLFFGKSPFFWEKNGKKPFFSLKTGPFGDSRGTVYAYHTPLVGCTVKTNIQTVDSVYSKTIHQDMEDPHGPARVLDSRRSSTISERNDWSLCYITKSVPVRVRAWPYRPTGPVSRCDSEYVVYVCWVWARCRQRRR